MKKVTAKQIGEIGEYVAYHYLKLKGFDLVGFGKEMHKRSKSKHNLSNIPTVPDISVAYSFGKFGVSFSSPTLDWYDSLIPGWADLHESEIKKLAIECKNCSICPIKESLPDQAPCANIGSFLDKDWLTGELPGESISTTEGEVTLKRHHRFDYCQRWLTRILLSQNRDVPPYGKSFLLINMLVSDYIRRLWWEHCDTDDSNKFQGKSHPGRYDFIGFKEGKHFAIEVKVNSSKLNYWQKVRLNLMRRYGCEVFVLKVSISKEQLQEAARGLEPQYQEIRIEHDLDSKSVPLPSDKEFMRVINYVSKNEQWEIDNDCYS